MILLELMSQSEKFPFEVLHNVGQWSYCLHYMAAMLLSDPFSNCHQSGNIYINASFEG